MTHAHNTTGMRLQRKLPTKLRAGDLHSIQTSSRHFGAMRVLPSAERPDHESDLPHNSTLARRLDQSAQFAPHSHKGPELPRSAVVHTGHYDGAELNAYTSRPGAMHAQALPSRMGNRLHYRDGRAEDAA